MVLFLLNIILSYRHGRSPQGPEQHWKLSQSGSDNRSKSHVHFCKASHQQNMCTNTICVKYSLSGMPMQKYTLLLLLFRDVTKFAFKFDNVRTSNVFSRFEIRQIFFTYPSSNSNLRSTRSATNVYTHRPPEQPTEQMRVA